MPGYIWTKQYFAPLIFTGGRAALFGSGVIDGPFSSYVALLGEVGLLGLLMYGWIYYVVFKKAVIVSRKAWQNKNQHDFALAVAGLTGMIYLAQMAFFDNWFEVARVTIPLWLIFIPILAYKVKETDPALLNAGAAS